MEVCSIPGGTSAQPMVASAKRRCRLLRGALLAALAVMSNSATLAAPAGAPLMLRVEHQLSSLGSDGVKRDVSFTERIYRAGDTVWIEREVPAGGARHTHEHAKAAADGHKHPDLSTAARWIEKQPSGKASVRLVSDPMKKAFDVEPAEFGNIGFDGSWATAYHLLDPAALKQMKAVGPVKGGVQQYQLRRADESVTVRWDIAGQYPRSVESRDTGGTSTKLTRVSVMAVQSRPPWARAQHYTRSAYTDLMD